MKQFIFAVVSFLLSISLAIAADWPQFRGPNRDGKSPEEGLLKKWPKEGPKKLWSNSEIGHGWSGVAVVGGKVCVTGTFGSDLKVTALDAEGKKLWQKRIDQATAGMGYRGARTTPTVDGERLYCLSDAGRLVCMKTSDGAEVWSVNILKKYSAPNARHSLAESPLVDGNKVICTPAGKASAVALDKTTGQEIWAAPSVDKRTAYVSGQIVEYLGLRQVVSMTGKVLFGVHAETGKLLWTHPRETPWEININAPHYHKGVLFVSSGYKIGTEALKLNVSGEKVSVKRLWNSKELDDHLGGMALVDNLLIGCCNELASGLTAIDIRNGKQVYKNAKIGESSIIVADGLLYVQEHTGRMLLVDPSSGKAISQFRIPAARSKTERVWAHPAISNGRLYVRHDSTLSVFDIKDKK